MHWDNKDKKMAPVASVGAIYGCYIIQGGVQSPEAEQDHQGRIFKLLFGRKNLDLCRFKVSWLTNCSINFVPYGKRAMESFDSVRNPRLPLTVKAKCRYSFIAGGQIMLQIKGDTNSIPYKEPTWRGGGGDAKYPTPRFEQETDFFHVKL